MLTSRGQVLTVLYTLNELRRSMDWDEETPPPELHKPGRTREQANDDLMQLELNSLRHRLARAEGRNDELERKLAIANEELARLKAGK